MTPAQIQMVRESLGKIAPKADEFAKAFYARLFELDPALRPLFKGDMAAQGHKLMDMIAAVVARLDDLQSVGPAIQMLGARHVGYGVQQVHYESVGAALLSALEKYLGHAFTPELRDSWAAAYALIAGTMKAPASPAS